MKRIIILCSIISTGYFLAPSSSFSLLHISNTFLRFECIYCHPEGVGGGLPKTPCLDCHKNTDSSTYDDLNTIEMATHSSELTSEKYGVWERECVDCHDPHNPNGVNIYDGITDSSYVIADVIATQAVTDSITETTTFNTMTIENIYDAAWTDPATWGEKTSPERGLLFVWYSIPLDKYYWNEVVSATETTITINAPVWIPYPKFTPYPINAQLIYGMLIENEVNSNPVKFSAPSTFAQNDGLGAGGTDSTPNGICQVCHTQTRYWRSDGTVSIGPSAGHHSGENCTTCHPHDLGFDAPPHN